MGANTLAHHGILGMKWGVRRYQNKDGTLTAAGKKRYADGGEAKNIAVKAEEKSVMKVSSMTDEELRTAIERMKLEKSYKEYLNELSPKKKSAGKEFVADILKTSGKNIATQLTTYAMGKAVNSVFGNDVVNPKKGQKDK